MPAKDTLEGQANNTYGIEIEFGTHDNQALSFTHIEVCQILNIQKAIEQGNQANENNALAIIGDNQDNNEPKREGWKLETDADYTLELVSPILKFPDQVTARKFRDDLMAFLEKKVRYGIKLYVLIPELITEIKDKFKVEGDLWVYTPNAVPLALQPYWITNKQLQDALSWENWDEDTDIDQVLATKNILGPNPNNNENEDVKQTILTKSRKHGGLPSSQLNLPLPLWSFVKYQTDFKRNKAWDRLLETTIADEAYLAKKRAGLEMYDDLAGNNNDHASYIWKSKYLNSDYMEAQIDEKAGIWHRYWLWLETFYICAGMMRKRINNEGQLETMILEYETRVENIVNPYPPRYYSSWDAKDKLRDLKMRSSAYLPEINAASITSNTLYLGVFKLAAGALSELSETLQKGAQEKLMDMRGSMTMEQIKDAIPNNQFMQFHYALKDLTSLWFKAPLIDTLEAEAKVENQENSINTVANFIIANYKSVAELIERILTANVKLLGWYYGVCAANNEEFEYDWEEFCTYNMPSLPTFGRSVSNSCEKLSKWLQKAEGYKKYLCLNQQLPQDKVEFLKRVYTENELEYLQKNNIEIGYIAPWEGRWDTMKKVIKPDADNKYPRYLIEHRNN